MTMDALSYMDCVILRLIREYRLSENEAIKAVKDSFLYRMLQKYPADAMHDAVSTSAEEVYEEIYG